MVDLEELKDKASVATPGPWCHQVKDGAIFTTWGTQGGWIALTRKGDDCAYIAAANPSAVLELIERLQQAEAERDTLKAERATILSENEALKNARNRDNILKDRDHWSRRAEKAEAELEAARNQEPIIIRTMEGFEFLKTYEIGTKLYASPVPPPAKQEPCGWQSKFVREDKWASCSKEHYEAVKAAPNS